MELSKVLNAFWKWLDMPRDEYDRRSMGNELEEFCFTKYGELIDAVCAEISADNYEAIDEILDVLAIDNEEENVLDHIEAHASDEMLNRLIASGIKHSLRNTRWQIAELLSRRKTSLNESALNCLMEDVDPYVRKRAKNSWERLFGTDNN